MSGCPVRVATWRGVLSSLRGGKVDTREDQHPPLLTQHRTSPGSLGMPGPLAQPCASLCFAYLVLQIEVCPAVLKELDSIQVPAPAGPVHGGAVQLDT